MKAKYQKIIPAADQSFVYFEYTHPAFHVPLHYHLEIEITQIMAGEGYRLIGDNRAEFSAGDLVIIGANLPHAYFSYHGQRQGEAAARVLQFGAQPFKATAALLPEYQHLNTFLDLAASGFHFVGAAAQQVSQMLDALQSQQGLPALITFTRILSDMAAAPPAERHPLASSTLVPHLSSEGYQRINQICDYINDRYWGEISQAALAAQVGLTPSAFSRVFHDATGRTFSHYVNEVRIDRACHLLVQTDLPVTQVAFDCGYRNLANFNRRFRQIRGMTPRAFRLRHTTP